MSYWHFGASGLLTAALIPTLLRLHLPLQFDWARLVTAFWIVLAAQSIFVAVLLMLIGLPPETFLPTLRRFWQSPPRLILMIGFFLILWFATTWLRALLLTVDTFAIIELLAALKSHGFRQAASRLLWPALYFFIGFLLIFAWNDILVSVRFNFADETQFDRVDRWLLHGSNVPAIAHWAIAKFPVSFFHFLESIYFGMFPQIGAGLILLALGEGRNRALQFVGAILTAYYATMIAFYFWPSQGPYYACPNHFLRYPSSLQAWTIQKTLIAKATALWNHAPIPNISTDFYTPFPCMHITQPLVLLWFMQRWKRIVGVLVAYDIVLILAVIGLEWHYFVDIVAAFPMALIAVATVDGSALRQKLLGNFGTSKSRLHSGP
jgi:PAP2 superfamily